jgi:hypothetical protein
MAANYHAYRTPVPQHNVKYKIASGDILARLSHRKGLLDSFALYFRQLG